MITKAIQACIESCGSCEKICTNCADECEKMGGMGDCVKLCRECAAACVKHSGNLTVHDRSHTESCIAACEACATECDKGADHMDICRQCAEACRKCAEACKFAEASVPTYTDHAVAVYSTHDVAEEAVRQLSKEGFDMKKLSIIGQDYHSEERPIGFFNSGDQMWSWGKFGAFWGAIWGLMFGSALMFIPGIGHVMLGGYIIGALQGAFFGGAFGVIGGALTSLGIPENSVVQYEKDIKAGSFLLIAHGSEEEVKNAKSILSSTPTTRLDSYSTDKVLAGHHH